VQGLGHDLTTIARVSLFKRIKNNSDLASFVKFISTVHDSIVLDIPNEALDLTRHVIRSVFSDLPSNFSKLFGCSFNLPVKYELSIGENLLDMETIV
jgi:DNA polymerase I-like protein with 3'-5' exonuclease and polymerase domains